MDSITQIALGAAIGEVTLGKKLGNKVVLWGGAIALVPDLDILANPLMDGISQLAWHRGVSHSILATAVMTPVFGALISRIHRGKVSFREASWLAFLAYATHILLDCFTTYGTQVFAPFSDYKVSWNAIFIVDPFYTVPLIVGVLTGLYLKRENPARRKRAWTGLIASSAYIAVALIIKVFIDISAAGIMRSQNLQAERYFTTPAPLSIFLWRVVAETQDGYAIGYISVFDSGEPQEFQLVERNDTALDGLENTRAVRMLRWFSDGYYSVTANDGYIHFHDLRFGEFSTHPEGLNFGLGRWNEVKFLFTFELLPVSGGGMQLERKAASFDGAGVALTHLFTRIKGI